MASIVIVEWTLSAPPGKPAPKGFAFKRVRLANAADDTDAAPPQVVGPDITSTRFDNVEPGDYLARVAVSNQDGSLGVGEQNGAVTVPSPAELQQYPEVVTAFVDQPAPDAAVRAKVK